MKVKEMPDHFFKQLLEEQNLSRIAKKGFNQFIVDSFFNFEERSKVVKENFIVWTLNYSLNKKEEESSKKLEGYYQGNLLKDK